VTDTSAARDGSFTTLLGAELSSADPVEQLHAVETYNVNAAHTWPDQAEGRYWRLTVTAEGGRRAWTNPVWP
jgi:hypothetical protein